MAPIPAKHAVAVATPANAVSLRPSTFAQGGGLISDADVTITRARFGYGYGGSGGDGEQAVTFLVVMKDGDDVEHSQYWSCGNGFVPSETGVEGDDANGLFLVPVADKTAPSNSSNFAMAITSLVNAGLPEDLLDGPISNIEGLKAHVDRIPAPKRLGLPSRQGPNANRDQTVLVFTSIIALPGEAAPAKGKVVQMPGKPAPSAAKPGAKAMAPSPAAGSPHAERIAEELVGVFAAEGVEELKKVQVVQKLFKSIPSTDPDKKAILADAGKDDVLASLEGFEFDGSTIKMA